MESIGRFPSYSIAFGKYQAVENILDLRGGS